MQNFPFDLDVSDPVLVQAYADDAVQTVFWDHYPEIKAQCLVLFPLNNYKVPPGVHAAAQESYQLGRTQSFFRALYNQCALPLGIVAIERAGFPEVAADLKKRLGCAGLCDKVKVPDHKDDTLSPLARAALAKARTKTTTLQQFHNSKEDDLAHFRTLLYAALNESGGWLKYCGQQGLLAGDGVQKTIAKLKADFDKERKGNPMRTVVTAQCTDKDTAARLLMDWCEDLLELELESDAVATEVRKLQSWLTDKDEKRVKQSKAAYETQDELWTWFVENDICDHAEVDDLIFKLRAEGVDSVKVLGGVDKQDLRECGFNIAQANAVLKVFSKK